MWQPTQPSCSCSCFAVLTWAKAYLSVMAHWVAECTHTGLVWLIGWHFLHCFHQKCDVYSCLHSPWYSKWLTHLYVLHWFWNVVSCCLLDFEYCVIWTKPFLQGIPRSWLWRAFHNYFPWKKPRLSKAHCRKGMATHAPALRQDSSIPSKELEIRKNNAVFLSPYLSSCQWNAEVFWLSWIISYRSYNTCSPFLATQDPKIVVSIFRVYLWVRLDNISTGKLLVYCVCPKNNFASSKSWIHE